MLACLAAVSVGACACAGARASVVEPVSRPLQGVLDADKVIGADGIAAFAAMGVGYRLRGNCSRA